MLTKKDIKAIQSIVTNSLSELYETLLLPYLEDNEQDHKEIKEHLQKHDRDITIVQEELDSIHKKLGKNQTQHSEMLDKLDALKQHATKQDRRIEKLEAVTGV